MVRVGVGFSVVNRVDLRAGRLHGLVCAAITIFAASLLGCRSCRDEHPWVPYSAEAGVEAPPVDGGMDPVRDAALSVPDSGRAPDESQMAPPSSTTWTLAGMTIQAPPGRVFERAFVRDFDGDRSLDVFALLVVGNGSEGSPSPVPGDSRSGFDLVFYRGRGSVADPPLSLATSPLVPASCSSHPRLIGVGPHSVLVEVQMACSEPKLAMSNRWLGVAVVDRRPRLHFAATVSDPPNVPHLAVEVDGADKDSDGIDDVTLRLTLDGRKPPFSAGPKVTATLQWLDRPAGLSRDSQEPEASLRALASSALTKAARVKEAAAALELAEQVRGLHAVVCAEPGSPRLVQSPAGTPIPCGPSRALEDAQAAVVRAHATLGDSVAAAFAASSAVGRPEPRPAATRTASRTSEVLRYVHAVAPAADLASLRVVEALPETGPPHEPAWGALAFEASGSLLVRTQSSVVRVDASSGEETPVPEPPPWAKEVVAPSGGPRFVGVVDPCDGSAPLASFDPSDGAPRITVPIPIATFGRCGESPLSALPVAWGAGGLDLVVGGRSLTIDLSLGRTSFRLPAGPPQPTFGTPRSPDGVFTVVPTPLGLLLRGSKTRLLSAKELEGGYTELKGCAVSNEGRRVACVRGGRAFLGTWEP